MGRHAGGMLQRRSSAKLEPMCNLYSMTKHRAAIVALAKAMADRNAISRRSPGVGRDTVAKTLERVAAASGRVLGRSGLIVGGSSQAGAGGGRRRVSLKSLQTFWRWRRGGSRLACRSGLVATSSPATSISVSARDDGHTCRALRIWSMGPQAFICRPGREKIGCPNSIEATIRFL